MLTRPPLYDTPESLAEKIQEYFDLDSESRKETISGLCYFLGFSSRQSFYDLESKPEFSYIVKRARLRLEMHYEELLFTKNCTGAIFALKNFGWKDRQEIDYSGNVNIEPITWVKSENK